MKFPRDKYVRKYPNGQRKYPKVQVSTYVFYEITVVSCPIFIMPSQGTYYEINR